MNKKVALLSLILIVSLSYGCNMDQNQVNKSNKSLVEKLPNKNQDNKIKWSTYDNERFNFSIKYPENFGYKESDNGDGATFLIGENDASILAYASHIIEDVSDPFGSAEEYNLKIEQKELDSGIEVTVIKGAVDSNYHYEIIYLADDIEYHFISVTSVDYYIENKDKIEEMANSFNISKAKNNKDSNKNNEDIEQI